MADKEITDMLDLLFSQSQMQFGSAIKSRWFYDGEGCPGCGRKIDAMKFKGKRAMSLNAFIFRDHWVLIAYLLCGKCGRRVLQESEKDPFAKTTPLHSEIEKNLKQAFVKHLGH